MARVRLDLDSDTYQRLLKSALAERRPVSWQAEVLLRSELLRSEHQLTPSGALEPGEVVARPPHTRAVPA